MTSGGGFAVPQAIALDRDQRPFAVLGMQKLPLEHRIEQVARPRQANVPIPLQRGDERALPLDADAAGGQPAAKSQLGSGGIFKPARAEQAVAGNANAQAHFQARTRLLRPRRRLPAAGRPRRQSGDGGVLAPQEASWFTLASSYDLSERISTFVGVQDVTKFSPEAVEGVAALADIFDRVCVALHLDVGEVTQPRKIARTLIETAMAGESDPEKLFLAGVKAVSN